MTATNLVTQKAAAPKIEHIETLCRALNCTPNDLYEWIPDDSLPENHQLNTLQRDKIVKLNNLMNEISLEKLADVEKFLKDMNKK